MLHEKDMTSPWMEKCNKKQAILGNLSDNIQGANQHVMLYYSDKPMTTKYAARCNKITQFFVHLALLVFHLNHFFSAVFLDLNRRVVFPGVFPCFLTHCRFPGFPNLIVMLEVNERGLSHCS